MSTTTLIYTAPAYTGKIRLAPAFDCTMIGHFAFARIKGDIFVVQRTSESCLTPICLTINATVQQHDTDSSDFDPQPQPPPSSPTAVDVKIFRHEFVSVFRYSHCDTLHPSEIRILEPIDDSLTRYEEDNGTLFLARDVTERLRNMTDRRVVPRPYPSHRRRPLPANTGWR
jgi:hypothetical protein